MDFIPWPSLQATSRVGYPPRGCEPVFTFTVLVCSACDTHQQHQEYVCTGQECNDGEVHRIGSSTSMTRRTTTGRAIGPPAHITQHRCVDGHLVDRTCISARGLRQNQKRKSSSSLSDGRFSSFVGLDLWALISGRAAGPPESWSRYRKSVEVRREPVIGRSRPGIQKCGRRARVRRALHEGPRSRHRMFVLCGRECIRRL